MEDYSRAIKLVPGDEAFYYSRGHAYFRMNKDDLAISDLSAAIKLQPKLAELYFWRGFSYERSKMYTEAKQDFSRVIASENDPAVLGEVRCAPRRFHLLDIIGLLLLTHSAPHSQTVVLPLGVRYDEERWSHKQFTGALAGAFSFLSIINDNCHVNQCSFFLHLRRRRSQISQRQSSC